LPVMLIGLGVYVLRGYIFKPKKTASTWPDDSPSASFALTHSRYQEANYTQANDFADRSRSGSWRDI